MLIGYLVGLFGERPKPGYPKSFLSNMQNTESRCKTSFCLDSDPVKFEYTHFEETDIDQFCEDKPLTSANCV